VAWYRRQWRSITKGPNLSDGARRSAIYFYVNAGAPFSPDFHIGFSHTPTLLDCHIGLADALHDCHVGSWLFSPQEILGCSGALGNASTYSFDLRMPSCSSMFRATTRSTRLSERAAHYERG